MTSTQLSPATTAATSRPSVDEYAPYYDKYVKRVPDGDIVAILRNQITDTARLLRNAPADRADHAYARGKWTLKEVVGHMIDVERVMSYRALRFSRNDATDLPGFDENDFVANSNFRSRTLPDLVDELEALRVATVHLAKHIDADALLRRGTANNTSATVRGLLYIIAGHELHHLALIRERYL
jgi:uncharacterized damage-inducible protein DinB